MLTVQRTATAQALVSFRGNRYSVPPELAGAQVTVTHRLGATHIELATSSGIVIARHHLAPAGAGATVRDTGHVLALERAAMAAFTTDAPHRRKQRIPPGPTARAAADGPARQPPRTAPSTPDTPTSELGAEVVVDLARYAAAAQEGTPSDEHTDQHGHQHGHGHGHGHGSPNTEHAGAGQPLPAAARPPRHAQAAPAAEHLPAVLDRAATEKLSLTATLERLLALEVDATQARRLAGRLRFASLPTPAQGVGKVAMSGC